MYGAEWRAANCSLRSGTLRHLKVSLGRSWRVYALRAHRVRIPSYYRHGLASVESFKANPCMHKAASALRFLFTFRSL